MFRLTNGHDDGGRAPEPTRRYFGGGEVDDLREFDEDVAADPADPVYDRGVRRTSADRPSGR